MSHIAAFTFNPFQENTYVVYDDSGECVIIDPGCYNQQERNELSAFIAEKNLNPVMLINTHCHVDHVLGNKFVADTYQVPLKMHRADIPVLEAVPSYARSFGFEVDPSPVADEYFDEGDTIEFGDTKFDIYFTPGHCPGHVVLHNAADKYVIGGDVLFAGSIGRTDLPGGDFDTLERSIKEKLYVLPDETVVYSGHGPKTTIGREKVSNPFVRA